MLFLFSPKIANAQEDPDWHFWTSQAVEAQVSRDISITMGQEYHVANDMSRLNFHWTDFNVAYAFTDWFEASISYRQVSHLLGQENRWIQEYRPHLNSTFTWNLGPLSFANRHRFEINRFAETRPNSTRYRNILVVKPRFSFTALKIQPSIKDEIWYDLRQSEVQFNHLHLGFGMQPFDYLNIQVHYLYWLVNAPTDWNTVNVLKVSLGINLVNSKLTE